MKWRQFLTAGILSGSFSLLAAVAAGQVIPRGMGYLFRLDLKPGRTYQYTIPTKVIQGGQKPFSIEMTAQFKVVKKISGLATLEGVLKTPLSQYNPPKATEQVTDRGEVIDSGFASGLFLVFPKDTIRIGDKFQASIPVRSLTPNSGSSEQSATTATYTFVGFTRYHGLKAARLTFKSKEAKCSGAALISVKDGLPIRFFATEFLPIQAGGKPIRADIMIIRK